MSLPKPRRQHKQCCGHILTWGVLTGLLRGALGGVPEAGTLSRDMLVATGVSTLQAGSQQHIAAALGALEEPGDPISAA